MITVDLHSPADNTRIGYGRAFKETRKSFMRLSQGNSDMKVSNHYSGGDIQIYFGAARNRYKEHYERKSDRFIIFTMWETTLVPDEVLNNLDDFDELIVPCQWCKDVYRNNGVAKPIHIVPFGIDPDSWPYMERKRNENHPFTIIWQGTIFGDRKGGEIVLDIFKKLKLPDSYLILKINPMYADAHAPFDLMLADNIHSVGMQLPQSGLLKLIEQSDLSIFPSHGEGFGLIPLEHMATGLPVIVADNTGMSQYCNKEYNLPVECEVTEGIYGNWCGQSYKPNQWQIEEYIKWAYENRDTAKELGRKASKWVKENWTYENTAKILAECLCQTNG